MAIIKNGIHVSGKMGDVVFYTSRSGRSCMRKRPVITKEPTEKQLAWRLKWKLASSFLSPMLHLLKDSWPRDSKKGLTPLNQAMSYLIRMACTGEYPDICIDYPKVALSRGRLHQPRLLSAEIREGRLKLSWVYRAGMFEFDDDEAAVVLVDPRTLMVEIYRDCALREDQLARIAIPPAMSEGKLHLYFIFISKYTKFSSHTRYMEISYSKNNNQL